MRTGWHEIWGCGRGAAGRLAPTTRLMVGSIAAVAVLISPISTLAGFILTVALTSFWVFACCPPRRILGAFLLLGLAMFLPYLLLVPFMAGRGTVVTENSSGALAVIGTIVLRGMSVMFISLTTVTVLDPADRREAILHLPLPAAATEITLQILHQSMALLVETKRIAAAMAIRGASHRGMTAWRMLTSLPQVWLPRIFLRAERVAAAMEVRGYGESGLATDTSRQREAADVAAVTFAIAALALAIALQWKWGS